MSCFQATVPQMFAPHTDWKIYENHDLFGAYVQRPSDEYKVKLIELTWSVQARVCKFRCRRRSRWPLMPPLFPWVGGVRVLWWVGVVDRPCVKKI